MVPSIEALRQRKFIAARVTFVVSREFLKEVAIPRMLEKDTGQLDDRVRHLLSVPALINIVFDQVLF
ncbi:hypothetical protein Q3G72_005616 [Acer saccharum]|nr:hypothetical protein Q3G72_006745 [Acer saccharum]KAK1581390.1 hypothetical protein Q3G72_005616 [Acer saccharum]